MIEPRIRAVGAYRASLRGSVLAGVRGGLVVAAAFATAGCVPTRFSGYEPTGTGVAETSYCIAGIRDTFRIPGPQGVEVFLRANRVALERNVGGLEQVMQLTMYATVPAGVTARLTSPLLRLESPDWERPRELEVSEITSVGPRTFGPTDPLRGQKGHQDSLFTFEVRLPGLGAYSQSSLPAPTRFTLHVPPFEVNGAAFDLQPVRFEAYTKWSVYTCVQ